MAKQVAYLDARQLVAEGKMDEEVFSLLLANGHVGAPSVGGVRRVTDANGSEYDIRYMFKRVEGGRTKIAFTPEIAELVDNLEALLNPPEGEANEGS